MFTGLVSGVARVVQRSSQGLVVDFGPSVSGLEVGESIALNGVCLTAVTSEPAAVAFDISEETFRRTALGDLAPGDPINWERAMMVGDRLGGHIVQGHVDEVGQVVAIRPQENSTVFEFQVSQDRLLVDKGSICLDGISLTVVEPSEGRFGVWVIPHTFANTNLGARKVGDRVNVEYDVIAKYVQRLTKPYHRA
ncbi:MAG: riboflavin synthase [Fimbriimonas sp.]